MTYEENQAARLSIVKELKKAIDECPWAGWEWKQKPCHPESDEASSWGSGKIMTVCPETGNLGVVCEVYDSCTMNLIIAMTKHIDLLLCCFASTVDALKPEELLTVQEAKGGEA